MTVANDWRVDGGGAADYQPVLRVLLLLLFLSFSEWWKCSSGVHVTEKRRLFPFSLASTPLFSSSSASSSAVRGHRLLSPPALPVAFTLNHPLVFFFPFLFNETLHLHSSAAFPPAAPGGSPSLHPVSPRCGWERFWSCRPLLASPLLAGCSSPLKSPLP